MEAGEAAPALAEGVEEISSLDEIFALRPEVLEYPTGDEEAESEEDEGDKKKKKGKKKKFVEVEYDPEKDVVIMKKKHKRGGTEWKRTGKARLRSRSLGAEEESCPKTQTYPPTDLRRMPRGAPETLLNPGSPLYRRSADRPRRENGGPGCVSA
jgi:hypothetical protein